MGKDATLERAISINRLVTVTCGGQVYTTRVESSQAGEWAIAAPYDGPTPVSFQAGEMLDVQVDNDAGSIRFQTRVRGRRVERIPVVVLAWPEAYDRQQRREYVRVPIRMPVHLIVPPTDGMPERRCPAVTRDLGGGGLQAKVTVDVTGPTVMGQRVVLVLDLSDGVAPVHAVGTVVRVQPVGNGEPPIYELGIQFVQVSERDRNRICRHIHNRQIELRRRGLL